MKNLKKEIRNQVWEEVDGEIMGQARWRVWYKGFDKARWQIREQVSERVWGLVREQVWVQVNKPLRDQLKENLR